MGISIFSLFLGVLLLTNTVSAHNWHRHDDESNSVTDADFTIPLTAGSEPADSAAVASGAEGDSSILLKKKNGKP